MARGRARTWLQGTLLAAPLVLFEAWVVVGGVYGTHAPKVPPPPPQAATARVQGDELREALAAFRPPDEEYPAAKLEDRVDGAADYLRGNGCRRILAWKWTDPPADLELLAFDGDAGAKAVLARDAGPGRQAGPGDEASMADQSILFRRGPFYARLMADPSARTDPAALAAVAQRLDGILMQVSRGEGGAAR